MTTGTGLRLVFGLKFKGTPGCAGGNLAMLWVIVDAEGYVQSFGKVNQG